MDADFWHNCWDNNHTGWHQEEFHPLLTQLFSRWTDANGTDVFVPLCGKSHDLVFISQSHRVVGSELSHKACDEFFSENKFAVDKIEADHFIRYKGQSIDLLAGDFFALDSQDVQNCGLIYDRAALVALSPDFREQYIKHLYSLFPSGTKLMLLSLEYPKGEIEGPPFCVDEAEVQRLFDGCKIERALVSQLSDSKFAQRILRVSSLAEIVYFIEF